MKVYLANSSKQAIGGGWSWISNIRKALPEVTDDYNEADIYLIPSPTMVQREEVIKARDDGKKIVLRVDNAVRNSRNRNTGMTRMKDFANWADAIIYQSKWAKYYLIPFLGNEDKAHVILNSVDTDTFYPGTKNPNIFLYPRYNRDETKNWEMARYIFSRLSLTNPNFELWIVGQFSPELVEGNFDFYNGEKFKFWGVQEQPTIAELYRQAGSFIYTYFNDACSNSLIEARVSGCHIIDHYRMLYTGGAGEIMHKPLDYFTLDRMANDYRKVLESL